MHFKIKGDSGKRQAPIYAMATIIEVLNRASFPFKSQSIYRLCNLKSSPNPTYENYTSAHTCWVSSLDFLWEFADVFCYYHENQKSHLTYPLKGQTMFFKSEYFF